MVQNQSRTKERRQGGEPQEIVKGSSIVGAKVINKTGKSLGTIADIMIKLDEGKVMYVIVAFGGFMGIRPKHFPVPFEVLTRDTKRQVFIFDQSPAVFESHPGFDKNRWPDRLFPAKLS